MSNSDEYLLVAYLVPLVAILWAIGDIKSLLVVAQLASVGFLIYGAFEVWEAVQGAGFRQSARWRLFLAGFLAYFLPSTSVLMTTICLQRVMVKAQTGANS